MWLQWKSKKENPNKMWLSKWVSQGPSELPITDRWLGESKLTTDKWMSVGPGGLLIVISTHLQSQFQFYGVGLQKM
jgi:hypothetical protein